MGHTEGDARACGKCSAPAFNLHGVKKKNVKCEGIYTTVLIKLSLNRRIQRWFLLKPSLNKHFKDGFIKTVFEKL